MEQKYRNEKSGSEKKNCLSASSALLTVTVCVDTLEPMDGCLQAIIESQIVRLNLRRLLLFVG